MTEHTGAEMLEAELDWKAAQEMAVDLASEALDAFGDDARGVTTAMLSLGLALRATAEAIRADKRQEAISGLFAAIERALAGGGAA